MEHPRKQKIGEQKTNECENQRVHCAKLPDLGWASKPVLFFEFGHVEKRKARYSRRSNDRSRPRIPLWQNRARLRPFRAMETPEPTRSTLTPERGAKTKLVAEAEFARANRIKASVPGTPGRREDKATLRKKAAPLNRATRQPGLALAEDPRARGREFQGRPSLPRAP